MTNTKIDEYTMQYFQNTLWFKVLVGVNISIIYYLTNPISGLHINCSVIDLVLRVCGWTIPFKQVNGGGIVGEGRDYCW